MVCIKQIILSIVTVCLLSTVQPLPSRWRSFLILFPSNGNKVFLAKKNGNNPWELPGGGSESGDRRKSDPIFSIMKREWQEETKSSLPWLNAKERFNIGTKYYYAAQTSDSLQLPNQLNGDGELDVWKLVAVADLQQYNIRRDHREGLNKAIDDGYISLQGVGK